MNHTTFFKGMPFILVAGGLLAAANSAQAQVTLYDNLANTTQGFRGVDEFNWQAGRFNTGPDNLMLTRAVLRLYTESVGGSGTFFLRLFSDNAGQPGTSLATLVSGTNPLTTGFQGINVAFDGLSAPLSANTNYWIVFGDNPGPALDLRWGVANPPGSGIGYQTLNAFSGNQGGSWSLQSSVATQMQLTATVVPEPGSMILGGLGLAATTIVGWRKRRSPLAH